VRLHSTLVEHDRAGECASSRASWADAEPASARRASSDDIYPDSKHNTDSAATRTAAMRTTGPTGEANRQTLRSASSPPHLRHLIAGGGGKVMQDTRGVRCTASSQRPTTWGGRLERATPVPAHRSNTRVPNRTPDAGASYRRPSCIGRPTATLSETTTLLEGGFRRPGPADAGGGVVMRDMSLENPIGRSGR